MATLEGDAWSGNVRELEAVVKRAMVRRRARWVTPGDIRPAQAPPRSVARGDAGGIPLTPVQEQSPQLASSRGEVRRGDLVARCGISPEAARRALLGLERARVVSRVGSGRAVRYVLVSPAP
jgi:DNA-binding NtrC family response regulator